MLTLTMPDGAVRTVEDMDINIYAVEEGEPVRLVAYEAYTGADGYKETNTSVVLFSADTSFSPEDYYDEWYGWNDLMPGDMPREALDLVNGILKEVEVPA